MSIVAKIMRKCEELQADEAKFFEKGNNAAGTRLRVGLQEIKALCQEGRMAVSGKRAE